MVNLLVVKLVCIYLTLKRTQSDIGSVSLSLWSVFVTNYLLSGWVQFTCNVIFIRGERVSSVF